MYQFSYAEIQTESVADARDRERQILDRSIDLLVDARDAGTQSLQAVEAIHFMNRVWTSFIQDLGSTDNELPKELLGRRAGDVAATYCDPSKAERELGWKAKLTIDDAARDAWNWQSKNPQGFATV